MISAYTVPAYPRHANRPDDAECARRYRAIRELMDALPLDLCPMHMDDACIAIWVEVEGWELEGYPHELPARRRPGRRSVKPARAPRGVR